MHILTMFYVLLALYNSWHIFVISILLVAFSKCHIRHMFVIFSIVGVFVKTLFYIYSNSVLRYFQNPLEIITTASIIYLFATLIALARTHTSLKSKLACPLLAQCRDDSTDFGPTLSQQFQHPSSIILSMIYIPHFQINVGIVWVNVSSCPPFTNIVYL